MGAFSFFKAVLLALVSLTPKSYKTNRMIDLNQKIYHFEYVYISSFSCTRGVYNL